MLRFVVLSLAIVYVKAANYGGHGGLAGGIAGGIGLPLDFAGGFDGGFDGGFEGGLSGGLAFGKGLGLGLGFGGPAHYGKALNHYGPVSAAIKSVRNVEFVPLPISREIAPPQVIDVEPFEQPVHVIFRSSTSPLHVEQIHHKGAPPQHESTRSEEEPSTMYHEVLKPVIQEFREVIQPYRKITQEVNPVVEEVRTIVAKGEGYAAPVALKAPIAQQLAAPHLAKSY